MDAGFRRFLQDDLNLSDAEITNLSVHQLLASRQCYEDKLEEQLNDDNNEEATTTDTPTAGPADVDSLIGIIFSAVTEKVPTVVIEPDARAFCPMQWPQKGNPCSMVDAAILHLTAELPKFKGDVLEQFQLVDAHAAPGLFSGFITSELRVIATADAVIIASSVDADTFGLEISTLVAFIFRGGPHMEDYDDDLVLLLLAVRVTSNKPVLAIVTDLATGATALRIYVNEQGQFYLERTRLTLAHMAKLIADFLKPALADPTLTMEDDSSDPDERATSMFLRRRCVHGIAVMQDQLAMYEDLVEDPEVGVEFKVQAAADLLRSFGWESNVLAFAEAALSRNRKTHKSNDNCFEGLPEHH